MTDDYSMLHLVLKLVLVLPLSIMKSLLKAGVTAGVTVRQTKLAMVWTTTALLIKLIMPLRWRLPLPYSASKAMAYTGMLSVVGWLVIVAG